MLSNIDRYRNAYIDLNNKAITGSKQKISEQSEVVTIPHLIIDSDSSEMLTVKKPKHTIFSLKSKSKLVEFPILNNKTGKTEKAEIDKRVYRNNSIVYDLKQNGEKVASLDIQKSTNRNCLYVNYAETSEEDSNTALYTLLRGAVEDYLDEEGDIPAVKSVMNLDIYKNPAVDNLFDALGAKKEYIWANHVERSSRSVLTAENIEQLMFNIEDLEANRYMLPNTKNNYMSLYL